MPASNSTKIRSAIEDDAEAISAVLLEAFVEYKTLYTNEGFAATTPTATEIFGRMKEGPMWLALSDEAVVATASAVLKGDSLYLRGMAVLPSARGQRIGNSLLEQIERYAVERRCRRLFLSTTPFLSQAIRLYQRFGFRRTDQGPHDLFGTPLFTMEKTLRTPTS